MTDSNVHLSKSRLADCFQTKEAGLLNIYFTAGYPELNSTTTLIRSLAAAGVDIIEIGIPFSDPLADGPTIQASGQQALENGMTMSLLLEQITEVRSEVSVPLVLMGYFNQVLQYCPEAFCRDCLKAGVDGLILPDLPLEIYEREYRDLFEKHGLGLTFLVTPQTSDQRIRQISAMSQGFVYAVSSASVTGKKAGFSAEQLAYFKRLKEMNLEKPFLIGFGISDHEGFKTACEYASGAVIGSAFIRELASPSPDVAGFVSRILN